MPVVVVSAGPGWGKTTLLAQWAARSDRRFAWVEIDEHDNDPIVLLTYVAAALDRIEALDPKVFDALSSRGSSLETTVVPRLGAALSRMTQPVVLVLDELQLLGTQECLDAVAALAGHVPDQSQLVLSARGVPAVPLALMRARGLALEVGVDDLRMDRVEAHQLLREAGLDLRDDDVDELTEQTEGWAAGLYLAALSAKSGAGDVHTTPTFTASNRFVSEYLRSELLAHVAAEDLHFLTRTSVLTRMSGSLCDAVLDTTRSAAALESLARSNLFLVRLDATGEWYRYHHLFRDLLRAELARTDPDAVQRLLARAADWSEANAQPETAIAYAQEADAVDRVARLVERWALPVYESGRVATVERWFEWLEPRGALERHASVAVLGALVATVSGRPAQAERWADAAEAGSHEGALPDGSASLDSWLAFLRALRCRGGVATMRADAEQARHLLALTSPHRSNALLMVAVGRLLAGELDEADELFADVAEEALQLGAPEAAAVALGERAAIAIAREAWVAAQEVSDKALRIIGDARMEAYPSSVLAYAVAARVTLRRGKVEQAQQLLVRSQPLRRGLTYALPWFAVQARLELARAYLGLADGPGAGTMLREIEQVMHRRPDLGTLGDEVEELRTKLQTVGATAPTASTLSEAELRILPLLATHLSFPEIGQRVYLSRHTVKSHAVAIYRKLSVTSRNEAIARAEQLGLL